MDRVFNRVLNKHPDVNLIVVSKQSKLMRSNIPQKRAVEKASCVLNFTDKARVLLHKILPDEPLEFVRIKGRKNEIFVTFDEATEIIVFN
jgi:hypothetical protein